MQRRMIQQNGVELNERKISKKLKSPANAVVKDYEGVIIDKTISPTGDFKTQILYQRIDLMRIWKAVMYISVVCS